MKGKITLIQILLVCVLIICSILVYQSFSKKNVKEFSDISTTEEIIETATPEPIVQNTVESEIPTETPDTRFDKYNEVYSRNNDMVGWIKVSDTRIDYPVMHNKQSNAYYLHRNIDKEYSSSGTPFLDYQCKGDGTSDNTIIYAHNMRNGTMFHDLLKYTDKGFYEQHKTVEFDTLTEIGVYEIFAVTHTKVGSKDEFKYYDFVNAETAVEFDKFVSKCITMSLYKTNVIPQYGDKILTLSTCSYNTDNERFVVFARKIINN